MKKNNFFGGAEIFDFGIITSNAADAFLKAGNEYLFTYNMTNALLLYENGEIDRTFTTPLGKRVDMKGLSGKELDYAMVEYEQTIVEQFTIDYFANRPNVDKEQVISGINTAFSSTFAPKIIKSILKENFTKKNVAGKEVLKIDFGSYEDRVKLGEKLIDRLYERE